MKHLFFLTLSTLMVVTFAACGDKKSTANKQAKPPLQKTEEHPLQKTEEPQQPTECIMIDKDHSLQEGWNVDSLYAYTCQDGDTRVFLDVFFHISDYYEDHHGMYALDANPADTNFVKLEYPRYDDDDFFSYIGGIPDYLRYLPGKDKQSLYVVTCVHANSNGWTTEYQLFHVNCETLEVKFLRDFAAIEAIKDGFKIAVARITNRETSRCTADEEWVMHDEYLDWQGNVTRVDTMEYDFDAMEAAYTRDYVKGFYGLIR